MEHYLPITTLNDFVFCPYSVYLHQIYKNTSEDIYHSFSQSRGQRLHDFIDRDTNSLYLKSAFVISEKLGIYGKIDEFKDIDKELIEYKSTTAVFYKGYYYQIWAQYLCLIEMGIEVKKLAFYDLSKHYKTPIPLPSSEDIKELEAFINYVKKYEMGSKIIVNPNKCSKCIYFNLCELKT